MLIYPHPRPFLFPRRTFGRERFSQHQEKGDSFLARLAREFSSFSRTAGEATMPVGAFYGQDGGELARRVSDHARSDPAREVHFLGQDRCVLWSRSDHARKVRFMVKKGGSMVSWTKIFQA